MNSAGAPSRVIPHTHQSQAGLLPTASSAATQAHPILWSINDAVANPRFVNRQTRFARPLSTTSFRPSHVA